MTLIVSLKCKDGIVIAGDKRSVFEDELHSYRDDAVKVFKINNRVAIAAAGDGGDAKPIVDQVLSLDFSGKDVNDICEDVRRIVVTEYQQWGSTTNLLLANIGALKRPNYGFIIAGYSKDGKAKIFIINTKNIRIVEELENYRSDGIREVAQYLFHKNYKQNGKLDDLIALAKLAIEETSEVSYAVSKTCDIFTITPKGIEKL